uniref:c-type cytochrome n=1 Tax=Altererythrobacter segetis TaxID=1104773 RepID=UPI001FAED4DD|nr:c-type cytochrome [Altererythrobacter segetis]
MSEEPTARELALPLALLAAMIGAIVVAVYSARQVPGAPLAAPTPGATSAMAQAGAGDFQPPPESAIPAGPEGEAIRRGMEIFVHTGTAARQYAGSSLTCSNCHLDGGRMANASPMWAAWVNYPAYRAKNGMINTMEDRLRGCFTYSMNAQAAPAGRPPPYGSDVYRDLEMYIAWLATGAPTRTEMKGRGYLELTPTADGHDPTRGAKVFASNCAACHGDDGQGMKNPDGTYTYPPLWGPHSFNWGAGMGMVANAAGFIKANMPLGNGYSLTEQEAWDVAAYVDSHERPPDPRQKGTTIEATRKAHHQSGDYYGQAIGGDLLGDGRS